jgi:hypothetical protein
MPRFVYLGLSIPVRRKVDVCKTAITLQCHPKMSPHHSVQVGLAHYQALYRVVSLLNATALQKQFVAAAAARTRAENAI